MDTFMKVESCEDGSYFCFSTKFSVALISVLSMVVCVSDMMMFQSNIACCSMKEYVECARHVLQWLFQIANLLLIVATFMENALLVSMYLWYTLSYVVLGLCVAILELLCHFIHEGASSLAVFGCEVIFYFVLSRCLPVVNSYKNQLDVPDTGKSFT